MPYERARDLIEDYQGNTSLIQRWTEGITHTESLLQPDWNANCLNWVLGHMLVSRHNALMALNAPPIWDKPTLALYQTGSAPISPGGPTRDFANLVGDAQTYNDHLQNALGTVTPEFMQAQIETPFGIQTRFQRVQGLHWHETFHLGQLEMLRALALSRRAAPT